MKTRFEQRPRRAIRPSTQTTATTATLRPQARQGLQPKPLFPPRTGPTWRAKELHPQARPPSRAPKSSDSGSIRSATAAAPMDETTSYAIKARTEMVHKVLEGLREEAFELAQESLPAPGGLRDFISRMRNVVFPRAAEEARERLRAGQRQGALARQGGESMLSYVTRRRSCKNPSTIASSSPSR